MTRYCSSGPRRRAALPPADAEALSELQRLQEGSRVPVRAVQELCAAAGVTHARRRTAGGITLMRARYRRQHTFSTLQIIRAEGAAR